MVPSAPLSSGIFGFTTSPEEFINTGATRSLAGRSLSHGQVGPWPTTHLAGHSIQGLAFRCPVSILSLPNAGFGDRGARRFRQSQPSYPSRAFSILVAGLGWASQGASWHPGFPWGFTSAIFTSVLPSIILAGVPDQEADRLSGKVTTVVRWGVRTATRLATIATGVALFLEFLTTSHGPFSFALNIMAAFHGLALLAALIRAGRRKEHGKIDGLLILALTYMVWFALEPFLAFWTAVPH